jgi:hypothetical protein
VAYEVVIQLALQVLTLVLLISTCLISMSQGAQRSVITAWTAIRFCFLRARGLISSSGALHRSYSLPKVEPSVQ